MESAPLAAAASPVDNFLAGLGFRKQAAAPSSNAQFTVAVTGSSGLVGTALQKALEQTPIDGKSVRTLRLVRRPAVSADEVSWDPEAGTIEADKLVSL